MSEEEQIDVIIDLLTEFDEMGFVPTTTVPDPDAYAIEWKNKLIDALKGYRKQSEGEWVTKGDIFKTYHCSVCNYSVDYPKQKTTYCPECGAKLKGGAE